MRFLLAILYLFTVCYGALTVVRPQFNESNVHTFAPNSIRLIGDGQGWFTGGAPANGAAHKTSTLTEMVYEVPALAFNNEGNSVVSVPIVHDPLEFGLAVAAKSMKEAVIAGPTFAATNPVPCFTQDGITCQPSTVDWSDIYTCQDAHYDVDSDKYFLVGSFGIRNFAMGTPFFGVAISSDSGKSFQTKIIPEELLPYGVMARYMEVVNEKVWYISAAVWPGIGEAKKMGYHSVTPNYHVKTSKDAKHAHLPNVKIGQLHDDPPPTDGFVSAILKTVDGGETFTLLYQNFDFAANQLSCPSENVCYFASENTVNGSAIFGTKDGGATWTQMLFISNPQWRTSMNTCRFLSETEGWCGGAFLNPIGQFDGILEYTNNGGKTWNHKYFNDWFFMDLQFVNGQNGYFAATNNNMAGAIVHYTVESN